MGVGYFERPDQDRRHVWRSMAQTHENTCFQFNWILPVESHEAAATRRSEKTAAEQDLPDGGLCGARQMRLGALGEVHEFHAPSAFQSLDGGDTLALAVVLDDAEEHFCSLQRV